VQINFINGLAILLIESMLVNPLQKLQYEKLQNPMMAPSKCVANTKNHGITLGTFPKSICTYKEERISKPLSKIKFDLV